MTIKRINEFPEGSGSLSNDDIFLFMDDPSNGGTTKKISLSQISAAIGGSSSFDAAVEWTTNHTLADGTRYLANDLVYNSGNLYRAKFDNESIPVTDTIYWENVGPGYRLNIDGRDIPNIPNPFNQNLNTFDAPTFNTIAITGSQIFGGGENSGDGNGYSTIELVPDSDLYVNDQYLIVDPTAPNHIHLRAGGTQDGSSAELILGGEHANLRVTDNLHEVDVTSSIGGPVIVSFGVSCDNGHSCGTYLPPGTTVEYNGVVYTVISYGIPNSCEETTEVLFSPQPFDETNSIPLFSDGSPITAIRPFIHKTWTFTNDGNLSIPGNILLNNGTSVAVGSYDNNTGGQNGISLNCAVGYELNWQGGRLKSTYNNGESAAAIFVDSPMSAPPVVLESASNSNSINTNAKDGDMFDITLTENSTLANPTNPVNGKTLRWRITQDGTGNRTVALGNKFNLPSSASSSLPWSTAANKMDVLAATYHAGRDKWDIVAFVPGY